MLSRSEMKSYAMELCIPLMQRTANRTTYSIHAFKPDQVGFVPAYLENLCRPFWGISPLLLENEAFDLTYDGKTLSIADFLKNELLAGLSPDGDKRWDANRKYMGDYVFENQNITELAGLLIGLFFAKEKLWDPISKAEKDIIANGLYLMAETAFDHSWPNNHYWFPLFTFTVLKQFGYTFERIDSMLKKGLDFLDSLYMGDGWYKDGAFGRFDYYEAWSLHLYPLLWTLIADDTFEGYRERKETYVKRTNEFLPFYTHWFDANGAQVPFGRSLSYRFAASALFPVAVLAGCDIDPMLAGRITRMNVDFFRRHYKTENGTILEEGYLYHSTGTVEGYTSDGGSYWCCKTFLALLLPESHPFWSENGARLPAEQEDFLVFPKKKEIQLVFEGHKGIVNLYNNSAQYMKDGKLTHRFGDMRAWYGKFVYSASTGFGCNVPDRTSYDNMISLMTPDETLTSHRIGWKAFDMENGMLHSLHTPFYNDLDTTVETWIIPLGGYHKTTCYGYQDDGLGECFDASIVVLRFISAVAQNEEEWIKSRVENYNNHVHDKKRSWHSEWYFWLCLSEMPFEISKPEIEKYKDEMLNWLCNKSFVMNSKHDKCIHPVLITMLRNIIAKYPEYEYIKDRKPYISDEDGRLYFNMKS